MTDELKAAAERLRHPNWMDAYDERPPFGHPSQQVEDWQAVTQAYLAENPADSELAVTEEWLRAVGFTTNGYMILRMFVTESFRLAWRPELNAVTFTHGTKRLKTRGDIRRATRALGVELSEGKS